MICSSKGHMIEKKWEIFLCTCVYLAVALLAISDTGVQVFLLHTGIGNSRILRKIAIALLFFKVFGTRYTKKEFFLIFPIMVMALYNYRVSGNTYCIYNILTIACVKNIDFYKLFKVLFWSTLSALTIISVLSLMNIGGEVALTKEFGRDKIQTRYCFGMYHPNVWHQAVSRCVVFGVLGYRNKMKWYQFGCVFVLSYVAYLLSLSRTGLLATMLFLGFIVLYEYFPNIVKSIRTKIAIFISAMAVYGVYFYFIYDFSVNTSEISMIFNQKFTNNRMVQAVYYLRMHPASIWGQSIRDDGTVFDCGFLRMFYESGYIFGILIVAALLLLFCYSLKYNYGDYVAVILFMMLYGLFEAPTMTRPSYNILIFLMGFAFFEFTLNNRKRQDEVSVKQ